MNSNDKVVVWLRQPAGDTISIEGFVFQPPDPELFDVFDQPSKKGQRLIAQIPKDNIALIEPMKK